jgi:hypothetical protein
LQDPKVRDRLLGLGVWPIGNTPAEFRKFYLEEIRAHAEMARTAGLKPE